MLCSAPLARWMRSDTSGYGAPDRSRAHISLTVRSTNSARSTTSSGARCPRSPIACEETLGTWPRLVPGSTARLGLANAQSDPGPPTPP